MPPPTRPPSRPCFGEARPRTEARRGDSSLSFSNNFERVPTYYRLYDLYSRQIRQSTDLNSLTAEIPTTGVYIKAAFDEHGRLIGSEKVMLSDR